MFAEPPPSTAKTWATVLTVLAVWILGGTWVWYNPTPVTVTTTIQVPPGTDPETLCHHPDIIREAIATLTEQPETDRPSSNPVHEARSTQDALVGELTAHKASDGSWTLSYSAESRDRANRELTALVSTLEKHISQPAYEKALLERRRLEGVLRELKSAQSSSDDVGTDSGFLQAGFETVDGVEFEFSPPIANGPTITASPDTSGIQERIKTLQQAVTESRLTRIRIEEEVKLVESGLNSRHKLDAIANQLSAGAIQDAVLQIDKQAQISNELQQLNAQLTSDAEIYGDRHPRLIERRRRFRQLLQDVGGWEQLIPETAIPDQVLAAVDQGLQASRDREDDLRLQLELEQSELRQQQQTVHTVSHRRNAEQKLQSEIAATQHALEELNKPVKTDFVVLTPVAINSHVMPIERFGPWIAVAIAGVIGGGIARRWTRSESHQEYPIFDEAPLLTVPDLSFITRSPELAPAPTSHGGENGHLNLAQRRVARQARWQQSYP